MGTTIPHSLAQGSARKDDKSILPFTEGLESYLDVPSTKLHLKALAPIVVQSKPGYCILATPLGRGRFCNLPYSCSEGNIP